MLDESRARVQQDTTLLDILGNSHFFFTWGKKKESIFETGGKRTKKLSVLLWVSTEREISPSFFFVLLQRVVTFGVQVIRCLFYYKERIYFFLYLTKQ